MKISPMKIIRPVVENVSTAIKGMQKVTGKAVEPYVGKISDTKAMDSMVKSLGRSKDPAVLLSHLASWTVTFFYLDNTRKSKKIDPERKPSLMINTLGLTIISSAIVPIIDAITGNLVYELDKGYRAANPGLSEELYAARKGLTKKAKSLTIFTGVVRFLVPVLMVPVTGTIVKKLKAHMGKNNQKEQQEGAQNPANVKLGHKMHKIEDFKPTNFVV